jgi:hypothetical protein
VCIWIQWHQSLSHLIHMLKILTHTMDPISHLLGGASILIQSSQTPCNQTQGNGFTNQSVLIQPSLCDIISTWKNPTRVEFCPNHVMQCAFGFNGT